MAPSAVQTLVALVIAGRDGASAERLSEMMWHRRPKTWDSIVRNRMSALRSMIGPEALPPGEHHYKLSLPSTSVDAWHLADVAAGEAVWSDSLHQSLLRPAQLFEGAADFTQSLVEEADRLQRLQRRVWLDHVLTRTPLTPNAAADCLRVALLDPFDEALAASCARALVLSNDLLGAQQLVREVVDYLRGSGIQPTPELAGAATQARERTTADPRIDLQRDRRAKDLLERHAALEEIASHRDSADEAAIQLVLAGAGLGKTSVLESAASMAEAAGWEVRFTRGSPADTRAYEALLPVLKCLNGTLVADGGLNTPTPPPWVAVRAELEAAAAEQPLLIVIDDAHELDSSSLQLVRYLARCELTPRVSILLGAEASATPSWAGEAEWLSSMASARVVSLAPLSLIGVRTLVANRFPDSAAALRHHLTTSVMAQTGGNPMLVDLLLSRVDDSTLQPIDGWLAAAKSPTDVAVRALPLELRRVGAAAATLGDEFLLEDLAAIAKISENELLDSLESLVERRFVVETEGLQERFYFSSVLCRRAFAKAVSPLRLRRLHASASGLDSRLHTRAQHLLAAIPVVPASTASAEAVRSARAHLASNAASEAVDLFRTADLLIDGGLEPAAKVDYAVALARIGLSDLAASVREEAITAALRSGDVRTASQAAMAGLPYAERADGDAVRLDQLQRVPWENLAPELAFVHGLAIVRQASLCGEIAVANRAEVVVENLVTSEEMRAALRTAAPWRPSQLPADRVKRWLPHVDSDLALEARLRLVQLRAIDEYSAGDVQAALDANAEFRELSIAAEEHKSIWYSDVFEVMYLQDCGRWEDAQIAADNAVQKGFEFGVGEAAAVRGAQSFFPSLISDEFINHERDAKAIVPGVNPSILFQAAMLVVRRQQGVPAEKEVWASTVRTALTHLDPLGLPALALLLEAGPGDPGLCSEITKVLASQAGTLLVVGGGIACLGPTDRYLAMVSEREDQQRHLLTAIEIADSAGLNAWRIRCRLDAANLLDDAEFLDQAASIAGNGSLASTLS